MYWARGYGTDAEGEFVKFLLLPIRFGADVMTLATGVVGFTAGLPLNVAYLISQIVFVAEPDQKAKWL